MRVLLFLCLFPLSAVGQQLECTLRDITRQANAHILVCDGMPQLLAPSQAAAQLRVGGNLFALCPPGTMQASLSGDAVQFDTPTGEAEPCDVYVSPNDTTQTNIMTPYGEVTLQTSTSVRRGPTGRVTLRRVVPGMRVEDGQLIIDDFTKVPRQK